MERHDPEAGIKVVPMYLEGEEVEEPDDDGSDDEPVERVRTSVLGILALALAMLTAAALVTGIIIASTGGWRVATIAAYAAIGLSVLSVIGGVVAVILGMGRRFGVIAVILGVFANPLVLLVVLRLVGGLETE